MKRKLFARNTDVIEDKALLENEIARWKASRQREMQIKGFAYYRGEHDVLARRRTAIGRDGALEEVENLPNNRAVNNQYGKLVTQKASYLLGKPFAMEGDDARAIERLRGVFDRDFLRTLKNTGKAMLCGGIAWLYPFCDGAGALRFRLMPAYEILPLWADSGHTRLEKAVRVYMVERWRGRTRTLCEKAEIYTPDGVQCLTLENGVLAPDPDAPAGVLPHAFLDARPVSWGRVPLLAFKANESEMPLLQRVKTLQDALDVMLSDFENRMQEDARNTILVLKNYDGTNLGEFRRNLAQYGAVKVRGEDGAQGGVDTLRVEFTAENYRLIISLLREALIENAMGFDGKDTRLSGNPNQLNIRSMYNDIDLDASEMETELQASMAQLVAVVNQYFAATGQRVCDAGVTFLFNRDMLMSESEVISSCKASVGVLSDETIVAQHPWVDDPQRELRRLARQRRNAEKARENAKGGEGEHG